MKPLRTLVVQQLHALDDVYPKELPGFTLKTE